MDRNMNNNKRAADSIAGTAKRQRSESSIKVDYGYRNVYMAGRTWEERDEERRDEENSFQLILQDQKIKDVCWSGEEEADGGNDAYVLYQNGKLKKWGKDQQLWKETPHANRKIQIAPFLTEIAQVACSLVHCIATKFDGSVVTWGLNNCGKLGRDVEADNDMNFYPPGNVRFSSDTRIASVACSYNASFCFVRRSWQDLQLGS